MAREEADDLIRQWSTDGYHLQHYWYFLSNMHLDLFTGEADRAVHRFSQEWSRLKASLLLLLPSIQADSVAWRARCNLIQTHDGKHPRAAGLLRRAARDAKKLARIRHPFTQSIAQVIHAEIAHVRREDERAVALLRAAIPHMEEHHMALYAAAARLKLASWLGGEEGDALMRQGMPRFEEQHIQDPQAMLRLLLP